MEQFKLSFIVYFAAIAAFSSAEIKLTESSSTSLEWDLSDVLKPGKKYSVEVFLNAPTGDVRVIDEPLPPTATSYTAFNLKSNKQYQLLVYQSGQKGAGDDVLSAPSYTNLRCYSCNGGSSVDECTNIKECSAGQRECYTRVRYHTISGRNRLYIFKGCKSLDDECKLNQERINLIHFTKSKTGELTIKQVLDVMPGLKFFGDVQEVLDKSPSIMKKVKQKYEQNKAQALENALKKRCARGQEDEADFCQCCCNQEGCNHAMLDCGLTEPPEIIEEEPLPPDIATPPPETTFPVLTQRKIPPACKNYNGGCDHICIPVNRTLARCECFPDYKLQDDGQTCKTHLKHAIADAGPDITVTLPRNSVILSAKETKGSVRSYKWWDPFVIGKGGGLTTSDSTKRDLTVTDLRPGIYKFILMVTGRDGRRTSDTMTLTVLPNPRSVNATKSTPKKRRRPQIGIISFNRFTSVNERNEWKERAERNQSKRVKTTTKPAVKITTPTPTSELFRVLPGKRRGTTTAEPETVSKRPAGKGSGKKPTRKGTGKTGGKGGVAKLRMNKDEEKTTKKPPGTKGGKRTPVNKPKNPKSTPQSKSTTTLPPVTCPSLTELAKRHVTAVCSDSNLEGSECKFECNEPRLLHGESDSASCLDHDGTVQWMNSVAPLVLPCCELPCPGNAHADIMLLIHSSTTIGRTDWSRILNMAYSLVEEYTFGDENVCAGAIRYHRFVDTKSAIPLDCSTAKADFKKSLLKLPFTGTGTNTAAALNYLRTNSFKAGKNRAGAQNVAVVITDSRSTAKVGGAAKALKASGVKIIVIGIKSRISSPNLFEMRSMASAPSDVINIPRIPSVAPIAAKTQLRASVCVDGCEKYDAPVTGAPAVANSNSEDEEE